MSSHRRRFAARPISDLSQSALLFGPPMLAETFTVTSTADAGAGSLREAILDANASPGEDRIEFAIPARACSSAGVCEILVATDLPARRSPKA